MGPTAADWSMVDPDHSIAPYVGRRLARNAHLLRRKVGDSPRKSAAQRAIAIRDPLGLVRQLDPHLAAVTAPRNTHLNIVVWTWNCPQRRR